MKNIVILYGGKSCEHDISIITACLARGYFANYNVYCVYLDKENRAYLAPNDLSPAAHLSAKLSPVAFLTGERSLAVLKRNRIAKKIPIDAVANCCHGAHGEDGTAAALCGLLDVPIIGSGITPSAVAMSKSLCKRALNSYGFPVVDGFEIRAGSAVTDARFAQDFRFPIIVKPDTLGSSVGVKVCRDEEELQEGVAAALTYDDVVLCEKALTDFSEFNCAAMRVEGKIMLSRVDEPITQNDILTFEDKYIDGQITRPKNADVPSDIADKVKELTERICAEMGFCGVVRVDYLYDNVEKRLYVNEINSIPGSLAYGLFADKFTLTEYGDALFDEAVADFRSKSRIIRAFPSSVLSASSGGKHGKK